MDVGDDDGVVVEVGWRVGGGVFYFGGVCERGCSHIIYLYRGGTSETA